MADQGASTTSTEDSSSSPEPVNPSKKVPLSKSMKPKTKSTHPSTADMVNDAIVQLAERSGSSLPAIKKFIRNTYNLDVDKLSTYIKRYLKSAVANGSLVQTTGRGASGSFKLPSVKQKAAMAKATLEEQQKAVAKKPAAATKTESGKVAASMKKQASSKKVMKKASSNFVEKNKTSKKITETASPPKSPSRTKKMAKSPTSKPKTPKPKKTTAVPKSPKVVAPKKMAAAKK